MHHLFYHANCADGYAAACIARTALLARAEHPDGLDFTPVNYSDSNQLPCGDNHLQAFDQVTYLDYTPPAHVIRTLTECLDGTVKLTIIDHHEKAAPLHGYTQDEHGLWHRTSPPPFESVFRFTRSGAGLAFNHFFPEGLPNAKGDDITPLALTLIEFRDLGYAFQQPDNPVSADALNLHAYLFRCIPRSFDAWDSLLFAPESAAIAAFAIQTGKRLRAADGCIIASAVNACHWLDFSHLRHLSQSQSLPFSMSSLARIPAVNGLDAGLISDACTALLKAYPDAPFAASWFINPTTGHAVYSLRSRKEGHPDGHVNVSTIAAACAPGGGGHPCAAGFSTHNLIPFAR